VLIDSGQRLALRAADAGISFKTAITDYFAAGRAERPTTDVRRLTLVNAGAALFAQHFATEHRNMAKRSIWTAHPHLAWAMWGLDEIEATVASIEGHLHGRADVHPEAHSAVADMRAARDAFRKSIEEHAHVDEAAFARTKAALEGQWAAFEDSVKDYLATVGKQVTEQETVFRARADAQGKAWQHAIDRLHESAANLAAESRGEVEAAVKRLEAEANAAKVRLDRLNQAEDASWEAMKSALMETRATLGRTHQAVLDAFKRPV
jgi:hypothetical protein